MKGFLRKVLLIASFGAALTFYGCNKDFTQDIEDVRNDLTTALEEQNSTLTAAINQAKEDAQKYADEAAKAAKDYADQVAAAAKAEAIEEAEKLADAALESAKTYADQVAKSEAEKAKAEVLEEIREDLEQTLADAKSYTDQQLKELSDELQLKLDAITSRIDGIDAEIDTLKETYDQKFNELLAADAALDVRITTLENFKDQMKQWQTEVNATLEALKGKDAELENKINTEIARVDELIDDLEATCEELRGLIAENTRLIKELTADLKAKYDELNGKIETLEDLMYSELADLKEYFDGEIADVRQELADMAAELYQYIDDEIAKLDSKIQGLLAVLEQVISDRLTSISLIPELYVGGIETFGVRGINFTAVQVVPSTEAVVVPYSEQTTIIPWYAADVVRYHLSPSNVTAEGIKALDYLIENATIVKSAAANELIRVAGYKVNANNELEVEIYRIPSYSDDNYVFPVQQLTNSNPEVQTKVGFEWPTAALKAGIADNLLLNDETEANVISEYSAYVDLLSEIHITPAEDKCNTLVCNYFYTDYTTAINPESPAHFFVNYDESIDLLPEVLAHVTGYSNEVVSLENLKKMGLDFRFAIPTAPQPVGDNNTDQQKFIKMNEDGHTFVSIVPGDYLNNEAAIGRTPLVRVELYEVASNKIVDVQWIKIEWVKEAFPEQDLGTIPPTFTDYLDCTMDYNYSLTWSQVNQYIIGAIKDYEGELAGMSHADYIFYYGTDPKFNLSSDKIDSEYLSISTNLDSDPNADPKTAVYTIGVNYAGLEGMLDEILKDGKATRNVVVEIVPRDEVKRYVGTLKFNINIEWTLPENFLPTVRYNLTHNWIVKEGEEGMVAQVNPVGYDDATNNEASKVRYNYDLLKLFNPIESSANAIVTNLDNTKAADYDYSCRTWDMQFATSNNGHKPGYYSGKYAKDNSNLGYYTYKIASAGWTANMNYIHNSVENNWYNSESSELKNIWFSIADNNGGDKVSARELLNEISTPVEERVKIPVKIMMNITPNFTNVYEVKTFDLTAIIPVTLPQVRIDDSFVDYNKDGQTIIIPAHKFFGDAAGLFKVQDFEGRVITENQFAYYGIKQPFWHLDDNEVYTNIVTNTSGNVIVNPDLDANNAADRAQMTLVEDTHIDFSYSSYDTNNIIIRVRNSQGSPLVEPVTLWIKVDYEHAFAEYSYYVPVVYDPNMVNAQ